MEYTLHSIYMCVCVCIGQKKRTKRLKHQEVCQVLGWSTPGARWSGPPGRNFLASKLGNCFRQYRQRGVKSQPRSLTFDTGFLGVLLLPLGMSCVCPPSQQASTPPPQFDSASWGRVFLVPSSSLSSSAELTLAAPTTNFIPVPWSHPLPHLPQAWDGAVSSTFMLEKPWLPGSLSNILGHSCFHPPSSGRLLFWGFPLIGSLASLSAWGKGTGGPPLDKM